MLIFVISNIIILISVIWYYSKQLNRIDSARIQSEESLRKVNRKLEAISECNMSLVTATDEIDHQKAEEELRESETKYSTLLESLPQKIFLKDRDSVYVSCNENYAKDLKIRADKIKGMTDYDFHPRDLAEKYRTDDKKIMESGKIEEIEENYVLEGKELFIHTVKIPFRNKDGNVTGVLGIFWDITPQKQAEKERTELEKQLRHMQKMEAIGQLTGGISHDFNNILTAIIGNSTILQMKLDKTTGLTHYVEQILSASEKAANLIRNLRAFSRKQTSDIKPVYVNNIIRNVEKLLKRLIGENIELNIKTHDEGIMIMADSGQMEQVLINLATNARDAMPDGGLLSIETTTTSLDDAFVNRHSYGKTGKYALISFSDTGTGMDRTTKEKIFEPYFTTKEVGKGSGLGMAIVYGIIKQHNGYITVYSEPGKVTTFKIFMPLVEAKTMEGKIKAAQVPAGGAEVILVAEDEADVRNFTKSILDYFGYTVIEAADGEDAINKFIKDQDKIQLLVLDLVMPKKNGKEVYAEIKNIKRDIRVIFTSGYSEEVIHKSGVL